MKKIEIFVLYPGYSAATDFGALGWGTAALIKADGWVGLLDSGGHTQRRQLISRIEKCGVKAEDICYIFLTHLHWDHANNVDLFPKAKVIISGAEWDFVQHDNDGAYYPPTIEMLTKHNPTIVEAKGEFIAPGIRAYLTPGHTVGSTTYVVEDDNERYALVGDAAKNWYEIETGIVKMTKNAEWSRQSIEKVRSLSSHILPGHDGWVDIVDGKTIPRHDNDVIINYPEGITINGKKTLRMYMD